MRRQARSPSGVPSRRWSVEVRAVLPRLRPSRPRPQGFHPPESPLPSQDVSALSGPMLPWALDRLVQMSAAHEAPTRPSRQVVPPRRFQAVAASASTREWRGRQDLGLSGSERADAGAIPKDGGPPARLAGSPKTATLPVRPVAPKGDQDRSHGVGRPEGRPRPRLVRIPKDPDLTPGEIPREFPSSGPFHPKVLGLRLHRTQTPKSRLRPSAQPRRAGTGVRA